MQASLRVGIDVGGTTVKLGALDPAGRTMGERSVAVAGVPRVALVLDGIAAAVRELAGGTPATGVGVGMPGLLDRAAGRVDESPNLPIFNGCALRDELARRLELSPELVALENDANAAALGEARQGAARGERDVLVVTLGTGVGGGLILGGELFLGAGLAGEIGHVMVDPEGPPCGCGSRGCLETLASATAVRRRALALGLPGDVEQLAAAARAAEGPERALLAAVGRDLGHGLAAVVCLLDLRTFVFAGGFAAALDVLEAGIRRGLTEWAYGERVTSIRLARAALGSAAGWIGAALLPRPLMSAPHRPHRST